MAGHTPHPKKTIFLRDMLESLASAPNDEPVTIKAIDGDHLDIGKAMRYAMDEYKHMTITISFRGRGRF